MGAGKKVNTVVLAVKNLPNINTAKFSPAPNLKNTAAALCLLVEGREEQSVLTSNLSEAGRRGNPSNWGVSVALQRGEHRSFI